MVHYLFLYSSWARNSFHIFKSFLKIIKRIYFMAHKIVWNSTFSAYKNKNILLEHNMLIHLHIILGCFHTIMAELHICERDCMVFKAENIYSVTLCSSSLPTPSCWRGWMAEIFIAQNKVTSATSRHRENMFWKFKQRQIHTCCVGNVECESSLKGKINWKRERSLISQSE